MKINCTLKLPSGREYPVEARVINTHEGAILWVETAPINLDFDHAAEFDKTAAEVNGDG